jgi:hypothetical protein
MRVGDFTVEFTGTAKFTVSRTVRTFDRDVAVEIAEEDLELLSFSAFIDGEEVASDIIVTQSTITVD